MSKLTSQKALTAKNALSVILMLGITPAATDLNAGVINIGGGVSMIVHDGLTGYLVRSKGDEVEAYPGRYSLVELTQDIIEVIAEDARDIKVGKGLPIAEVMFKQARQNSLQKKAGLN